VAKQSNQTRWIIALGALVLIGVLAYSTYLQTGTEYEVCLTFKGAMQCAKARGSTREEAVRSAQDIDCATLANGRDELMVCTETPATSVREIK
jgi:hypothetical protein